MPREKHTPATPQSVGTRINRVIFNVTTHSKSAVSLSCKHCPYFCNTCSHYGFVALFVTAVLCGALTEETNEK